jgi:hypothetical protein
MACNKKKCLIGFVSVFATLFVFEYLFHGCSWMMEQYNNTATLWRTPEDMGNYFYLYFIRIALLSAVICCLYKKFVSNASTPAAAEGEACATKKCCPHQASLCFGVKIGLLIGTIQASSFIWMPIPAALGLAWFFGGVLEGALVGLVLSFIYKKKECSVS